MDSIEEDFNTAESRAKELGAEPKGTSKKVKGPLWKEYKVVWKFVAGVEASGWLLGVMPKDPEQALNMILSRQPEVRPPGGKSIPEIQQEIAETMMNQPSAEEEIERISVGFQYVQGIGHCISVRQIRGHIKDCGRYVSTNYVGKGPKGSGPMLGYRIVNGCYPKEYWTPICRLDGTPAEKPDGQKIIFVHVVGPRGPRDAIKIVDYFENVMVTFTLKCLNVSQSDLETVMQYGATHGFLGERGPGEGRYLFEITPIETEK